MMILSPERRLPARQPLQSTATNAGSETSCVRHAKRLRGFALSPREERAGRESERGETDKKCLLSPALSSFLRRRGRANADARPKQTFCRTKLVCDPQQ